MRVLTLSRNYPSDALPLLGPWVEGLVRRLVERCDVEVVAPVPFAPPVPGLPEAVARFARVPREQVRHGVRVHHPRFLTGPGYSTHVWEGRAIHRAVRSLVDRLHRRAPFDLIHAHFVYPDGVVAARLARRLGVPYVITEHAIWEPWMTDYPGVRRQAVPAARGAAAVLAASGVLADSIRSVAGDGVHMERVPIGFDEAVFAPGGPRDPDRIVCVGRIQRVKGVDVLLRAFARVREARPEARLTLVGGSFYRAWEAEETEIRALGARLGVDDAVTYTGVLPPPEVARHVRTAAVLASPSRRESFGAAVVEALGCGTPVVATQSGGPQDVVTPALGRLVEVEDPEALAAALLDVLVHRDRFDPVAIRAHAVAAYGWASVSERVMEVYGRSLWDGPTSGPSQ